MVVWLKEGCACGGVWQGLAGGAGQEAWRGVRSAATADENALPPRVGASGVVNLYCLTRVINVHVGLNINWNKSTNAYL